MNTATQLGRTVSRMHDSIQAGASYGCAVTRYESSAERNWRWAHRVMYVVALVAVPVAVFA